LAKPIRSTPQFSGQYQGGDSTSKDSPAEDFLEKNPFFHIS